MDQNDLAAASGVSKSTIGAFEIKDEGAFERAGLLFISENGGGPGVRLRDPISGRQQADQPPADSTS
jgi:hypothetical protein